MELGEIFKEFLIESYEYMDQLDRDFVELEGSPGDREIIARIFRAVHSIKGACGFLGLGKLEKVAHSGESLLSHLRDGELVLTPAITTTLLKTVDAIREILANIEATSQEGDGNYEPLVAALQAHLAGVKAADDGLGEEPTAPVEPPPPATPAVEASPFLIQPGAAALPKSAAKGNLPPATPAASTTTPPAEPPAPVVAAESPPAAPAPTPEPEPAAEAKPADSPSITRHGGQLADSTIRVDVGLLDRLGNLVGELVLVRNQILEYSGRQENRPLLAMSQRLNLIASELQEGVMKTRMQPIDTIWSKFPRLVRDLAAACGKQVRLELQGKETELDKSLIEAIKDPLTHILRNSVDHGVEPPQVRAAAGKPEQGTVLMRAFHEGGLVNVEIIDDGGGIDPERVRRKAIERGLIEVAAAQRLTEREVLDLIFLPGFSTAARVTNLSGRGVGMDVVKTNIERIGGTVELSSRLGQGTELRLKIPLTLAIIPALVVKAAGERYAIPQVSLLELVRLKDEQARVSLADVYGAPVYRRRGRLLPLVELRRELRLPELEAPAEALNLVVLGTENHPFGLVVDEICDTQEIVVKPLGRLLREVTGYAGATILGDGRISLILDVEGLAQRARLSAKSAEPLAAAETAAAVRTPAQTILLFNAGGRGRLAMRLDSVARLEEFAPEKIELVGEQRVVQYRGRIMPLVDVFALLPHRKKPEADAGRDPAEARKPPADPSLTTEGLLQVAVCEDQSGRPLGLLAGQIQDIARDTLERRGESGRPGVICTLVVQDKVVELLDVDWIVRRAAADLGEELGSAAPEPMAVGGQS